MHGERAEVEDGEAGAVRGEVDERGEGVAGAAGDDVEVFFFFFFFFFLSFRVGGRRRLGKMLSPFFFSLSPKTAKLLPISYRWCICDILEARCAYCASSIRLRTATAGGGKSVDVRAPPAARPPEGVRASPEAFFSGGRSGGTAGCCC